MTWCQLSDALIWGKDPTKHIVSCEVQDNVLELFFEHEGKTWNEFRENKFWLLANKQFNQYWKPLEGNLHYKYICHFTNKADYYGAKRKYKNEDLFGVADDKEAAMLTQGFTYFKDLKIENVSVLFFDIETTGLTHDENSKVLLISNTFRKNGKIERKLFAYDEYDDVISAWCDWVRDINPSIMVGHNIFGYDLPYLSFCSGNNLCLGRDESDLRFARYTSKFRKDGSQDYEYTRAFIYGREIVDTMFLAYHYDIGRKYESYGLKAIIKHEGLEVAGRQFYDASTIHKNYKDLTQWSLIKKYAEHDADDAMALYDLMIPAYFYLNQSVPKSFQMINYSASGSQINSFLMRSYLQEGHSLPKATEGHPFEGAISLGNSGIYRNVFKIDVASLYPSIMIQDNIYDRKKDPKGNFARMVSYYTDERLNNKYKGKTTGDRYYKDLEQAQKIIINSAYGMLAAPGLLFNSPANAAAITRKGRSILSDAMGWATANDLQIVNADTDSISVSANGEYISPDERVSILKEVNSLFPSKISWEDDGYYPSVVVLKSKNYALLDEKGKLKIKGSALKSSKTEKAIKEYMYHIINKLLTIKEQFINDEIQQLYKNYIQEVYNIKDISRWTSKKTITNKVLNAQRTNEQKLLDALGTHQPQMGDKVYVYFKEDKSLGLQDEWTGQHDKKMLLTKLYKTLKIFSNVIDISQFKNYALKKNNSDLLSII